MTIVNSARQQDQEVIINLHVFTEQAVNPNQGNGPKNWEAQNDHWHNHRLRCTTDLNADKAKLVELQTQIDELKKQVKSLQEKSKTWHERAKVIKGDRSLADKHKELQASKGLWRESFYSPESNRFKSQPFLFS